jgi:outer membrane lipoprotein
MSRLSVIVLNVLLLSACASQIPEQIRNVPPDAPSVVTARADIESAVGARVRWGGTIAEVANRESQTWIEIVARDLRDDARPRESDHSQGRFLARFEGFLDPQIYSKDREITVVGEVKGAQTGTIDEYDYRYPVVDVESHYLWEPLPDYGDMRYPDPYSPFYYDPFFYDPFYDSPFYGRHPYFW